jgi:preprotein translocase subunit SecF
MPVVRNPLSRLFRGETSFDFANRWRRWFAISGIIIVVGMASVGIKGLNFSIEFKGGTSWEVPTSASVTTVRNALGNIGGSGSALRQATIQTLTNRETGKQTIEVQAPAKETANSAEVSEVTAVLAKVAHVSTNDVELNDIGPSWGSDITDKAIEAVIVFLVIVSLFIWIFFEGKMAVAALTALVHDILITVGLYSLSGLQVSPDTVIAFLTILGYSLYDTIVVFDRVRENTKGLASTGRLTYTDTVNVSMNQVLARSINTSFVAVLPILSILVIGAWVLGASALQDFGLALFIGLTTGAYSSIFIASPLLAILKEREPRYAQIRARLANRMSTADRRLTPAAVAAGRLDGPAVSPGDPGGSRPRPRPAPASPGSRPPAPRRSATSRADTAAAEAGSRDSGAHGLDGDIAQTQESGGTASGAGGSGPAGGAGSGGAADSSMGTGSTGTGSPGSASPGSGGTTSGRGPTRPPPRPRKKGRRR